MQTITSKTGKISFECCVGVCTSGICGKRYLEKGKRMVMVLDVSWTAHFGFPSFGWDCFPKKGAGSGAYVRQPL